MKTIYPKTLLSILLLFISAGLLLSFTSFNKPEFGQPEALAPEQATFAIDTNKTNQVAIQEMQINESISVAELSKKEIQGALNTPSVSVPVPPIFSENSIISALSDLKHSLTQKKAKVNSTLNCKRAAKVS